MSSRPVPVTILSGFLGAGKTTLLNRILNGDHGLRIAVLVNDFGSINIDADLVVGVEDDMISLANGCVCCQVRDDLVEAIDLLLQQPKPVDYVLLEASGVADPGSIYLTFADQKYHDRIRVDSITCVVDAEQVLVENEPEPVSLLKLRQIGFADLLIINKTDLAGDEQIARVRKWVDSHLNRVRIVESIQCNVSLEILLGAGRFDASKIDSDRPASQQDHGAEFQRWSFETVEPVSLRSLRKMVRTKLPAGVYRCKGIVHSSDNPDHRSILQVVGRRCDITMDRPWDQQPPGTRIVAIGESGTLQPERLQNLFENCIEGRESKNQSGLAGVTTERI